MFLKTVLILLSVVAASTAQNSTTNVTTIRIDDYIAANKRNFENTIRDCNYKLLAFEELYNGRLDTIDIQKDLLVDTLRSNNERLSTLAFLSDSSKSCVNKYQNSLPTEYNVTVTIQNCTSSAKNAYRTLVTDAKDTRWNLEYYYDVTINEELKKCGNSSNLTAQTNYTLCVTTVIDTANVYAFENHKIFNSQMEEAACSANTQIKKALDCSFNSQGNVFQAISATNLQVNMCIQGTNSVATCPGYYCQNVERVPATAVNPKNQTMPNPFYGRNGTTSCLMLDIV